MRLSILICTLHKREKIFNELYEYINLQINKNHINNDVEILFDCDNKEKAVGGKRNDLLNRAAGDYIVFIDDDDWIHEDYVLGVIKAIESNPDCIGYEGYMTSSGIFTKKFKISKDFNWDEDINYYYRHINHISPVKRNIALQIGFDNSNCGEDYRYSMNLKNSKLLNSEVYIPKDMYIYRWDKNNTETQK